MDSKKEEQNQYLAGLNHGYLAAAEKPELVKKLNEVFDQSTYYGMGFLEGVKVGGRRREIELNKMSRGRGI
ncbi:MAG: hypothetical protein ACI8Q1_003690 [Parvicella sp.]|jgi:hypothetical protein